MKEPRNEKERHMKLMINWLAEKCASFHEDIISEWGKPGAKPKTAEEWKDLAEKEASRAQDASTAKERA